MKALLDKFAASIRGHRLAWTCCIVISLVLIYRANAPIFPVLLGCVLALMVTGMKRWPFRSSMASRRTR